MEGIFFVAGEAPAADKLYFRVDGNSLPGCTHMGIRFGKYSLGSLGIEMHQTNTN